MSLNAAQTTAVETLSGPLLVLAGAGTGKTRVVTYRIARLIRDGIKPNRILAVTFTNKAAKELQSRIAEILKGSNFVRGNERPEASTFHSLCVRILRRHITKLGYPREFGIYDRGDQESLARQVLREVKVTEAALKPGELISRISTWKNQGKNPEMASEEAWSSKDHLASLCYRKYQTMLKTLGAVDFDDLLLVTEELFRKFPDALAEESGRFDHLLVDEYQDTNQSQYRIVKGLALPHRNLCVVGDDDQAIYGWRGAEITHILNFKRDWQDAKVVRLEENYRSTKQIIDWANRLILFNKHRHGKKLISTMMGEPPQILQCKDGEIEAKTVVTKIRERIETTKRKPSDFAILFRTNEQPRAFEMELRNAKLPYTLIGGQSFFDRKEVRDILAYLKFLSRPKDEVSLLRIINTPPRGIGQNTIRKMTVDAIAQNVPLWEHIKELNRAEVPGALLEGVHEKSNESLRSFQRLMEEQRHVLCGEFSVQNLQNFISAIDYEKEINRNYQTPGERDERWDSIEEVINAAAAYISEAQGRAEKVNLWGFLDATSLAGPDFGNGEKKKTEQNGIALMTLHAAKGLEFPEVYMVGMEEGTLPHHKSVSNDDVLAVDEERRLCYVGLTRAQRRLTLTLALQRMKWGKPKPTIPSRFLYEITGQSDNPNYARVISGEPPKRSEAR